MPAVTRGPAAAEHDQNHTGGQRGAAEDGRQRERFMPLRGRVDGPTSRPRRVQLMPPAASATRPTRMSTIPRIFMRIATRPGQMGRPRITRISNDHGHDQQDVQDATQRTA